MLRRLRIKYVLVASICITFLFVVLYAILNIGNYIHAIHTLDNSCQNIYSISINNENNESKQDQNLLHYLKFNKNKESKTNKNDNLFINYFIIYFNAEKNEIVDVDFTNINNIDDSIKEKYSNFCLNKKNGNGFINEYRFLLKEGNNDNSIGIFLDASSTLNYVSIVAIFSLISALIAWGGGLLLIYFLSGVVTKPIEISLEKQKEFITNASHELKTPLTVISTNNKLIEMEMPTNKWVKKNNEQIDRLVELINELISVSKFEEESNKIHLNKINLSSLLNNLISNVYPVFTSNNLDLIYSIQNDLYIKADEDNIKTIILSLFDNAIKYADKDAPVIFDVFNKKRSIIICLKNNASTLKKEDEERIFERFYRKDESRTNKLGFGVGLNIVQSLVKLNYGKIKANIENNSITFTIVFRKIEE